MTSLSAAFIHAVYVVAFPTGPRDFVVGPAKDAAPPFIVITGWNPGGKELCLDENVARNAALQAALRQGGWRSFPAENHAPDGRHREPGFAILGIGEADALALARRFGQLAVFAFDGVSGRVLWVGGHRPGALA